MDAAQGCPRRGWSGWWPSFVAAYAVFLGLQVLDLLSTLAVLSWGGAEGNALAVRLMGRHGLVALLALKLGLVGLSLACWTPAMAYLSRHPQGGRAAGAVVGLVTLLCVHYAVVVSWNFGVWAALVG